MMQHVVARHNAHERAAVPPQRGGRFPGKQRGQPIQGPVSIPDRERGAHHLPHRLVHPPRLPERAGHHPAPGPATSSALTMFTPVEPPTRIPSSRARRRAIVIASLSDTNIHSSIRSKCSDVGILSPPIPSTLYGAPSPFLWVFAYSV